MLILTEFRSLTSLTLTELQRVGSGYISDKKFTVSYIETENQTTFTLRLINLEKPYVKRFEYDEDTLRRYAKILTKGHSMGAFDGDVLVGLIIGEPHEWNRSLWVPEFHVVESRRNLGIGAQLMEFIAQNASQAGFRIIVCETQNTNVPAIRIYQKLGFRLEAIDISYYSNQDYPDGEIAVFMKRKLIV